MSSNCTNIGYVSISEPQAITDLSAVVVGQDILLSWKPEVNSTQDSFYIWYRPLFNASPTQWKQTATSMYQTTLRGMFAGERYEMIVFAVSMGEMGIPRNVFAEIGKYSVNRCPIYLLTT